jgi:hypothetical protein
MPPKEDGGGRDPMMARDSRAVRSIVASSSSSSSSSSSQFERCEDAVGFEEIGDSSVVAPSGATKHADDVDIDAVARRKKAWHAVVVGGGDDDDDEDDGRLRRRPTPHRYLENCWATLSPRVVAAETIIAMVAAGMNILMGSLWVLY